ncbi:RHS repeat-associated core domain-containing protein [Pseudomonas syringae]|nr:RHS repeat-associated core domain-containing protein [Pseudomonas syringae]
MNKTSESRRVLCRYRYDALDRIAVVDPEAQEAVSRFYRKNRLTVEIQGAVRRRVFHAEDRVLAEYEADGAAERVDLLGTDMQSSVLHAVSSQGRQPLAYSPYGHRAQGGPFSGFNGERADPVTGHYLLGNGYRAFNPVLMRFNSPDSLSPFGRGGLNAYAYCQGDPVNRSDSGGHISSHLLKNMSIKSRPPTSKGGLLGVVNQLPIDTDHHDALSMIHKILKGEMSFSTDLLENDAFIARFEDTATYITQTIDKKINEIRMKSEKAVEKITDVPPADYLRFKNAVAKQKLANAADPETLQDIDRALAKRQSLVIGEYSLINERKDIQQRIEHIRSSINPG